MNPRCLSALPFPSRTRGQSLSNIFAPEFPIGLHDDNLPLSAMARLLLRSIPRHVAAVIGLSEDRPDFRQFKIMLNVSQFKPNDIEVKTVDNYIVIHGKHEEKIDAHGFVSREFTRRYPLPDGAKPESVKASLSPNGVLTIVASRNIIQLPDHNEKIVPMTVEKPVVKDNESDAAPSSG